MTGERISPDVLAKSRDCLMGAPPARPGKAVGKREGAFAEEAKEQPPDLGRAEAAPSLGDQKTCGGDRNWVLLVLESSPTAQAFFENGFFPISS